MDEKLISEIVSSVLEKIRPSKSFRLNLQLARKIIYKTEKKAKEMNVNAVVAVCNEGGNTVAVECMDSSYIASYDIAVNKAFTSASLKMKTKELGALATPGGSLYGIQFTNNNRIVIFGGGVPLKIGEDVIGAVGVSGGSEEEDSYLSEYALKVFEEEIKNAR